MTDETRRLRDARSYDGAADTYERINAPRYFDAPARALIAAVAPASDARILDVGCGTGAVSRAARTATGPNAFIVALDPSLDMLQAARRGGVDPLVMASLPALPFVRETFDIVVSAFVLTHVDDPDAALADMARVLRPGGCVGVSAWAAGDDEIVAAWSQVVERFVPTERMSHAADIVLPGEGRFSKPEGLREALRAGGFADVRAHDVDFEFRLSVEEYIAGREVCASGRALQTLLPQADWHRFQVAARTDLTSRFPGGVAYQRRVFIATGRLQ